MEAALALLLILGFLNESETPVWSEEPQECKEITFDDPYVGPNTVARIEKTVRNSYICVEEAEAIRLPSYIQLLNLPPAETKPIVAVYSFADKTGQRKDVQNAQSFSTATTQGGVEL